MQVYYNDWSMPWRTLRCACGSLTPGRRFFRARSKAPRRSPRYRRPTMVADHQGGRDQGEMTPFSPAEDSFRSFASCRGSTRHGRLSPETGLSRLGKSCLRPHRRKSRQRVPSMRERAPGLSCDLNSATAPADLQRRVCGNMLRIITTAGAVSIMWERKLVRLRPSIGCL
jgi:hypothetical protein